MKRTYATQNTVKASPTHGSLSAKALTVNDLTCPMGIDTAVRFSWINEGEGYARAQSAYRILVSSSEQNALALIGDLWDSGKTLCENNYDISYEGLPLSSCTAYYVRVSVWDESDLEGAFSEITRFETGILSEEEWRGRWIGQNRTQTPTAKPLLRKRFRVASELVSARAYVAGLGLYVMKINGCDLDGTVLNPAHTQYEDRVHYRVYDLTEALTVGDNVISVALGDGFYDNDVGVWNWQNAVWRDHPKLLAMLRFTYADGRCETVVSDESWKIFTDGPTLVNNILLGDVYDARREVDGWESARFDDTAWQNASLVAAPSGKLVFGEMEPMRRLQSFTPTVTKLGEGVFLIRNPVMTTGWASIRFDTVRGEEIVITYGERLEEDGSLKKPTDFGLSFQIDRYITKGVAGERYEPQFSYKGYQYIQIENYHGELTANDVVCYRVANDVTVDSTLVTGNALINQLHEAMRRTVSNNLQGKPTDTPVWEKNGWTGDFHVSLESILYNYRMPSFTRKFLYDLVDASDERGVVPVIAPTANWGPGNQVVWNGVLINAVYELFRFYGQRFIVECLYPAMQKQVAAYLCDMEENGGVWQDAQLCDWVSPYGGSDPNGPTLADASEGAGICGTGYVYLILSRMKDMAELLQKKDDAAFYQNTMDRVYQAFNERYFNHEKGYYETGYRRDASARSHYRQTSNLVPLAFGLCPEEQKARVVANLIEDLSRKDLHLDTGMVGTKLLLPTLSREGYHKLAYRIIATETYPSWGYWIKWGADTTWEGYENTARSHNHYFLGTYDEWLYRYLAGIETMTEGFKTVTLAPYVIKELGFVNCTLHTVRGSLTSNWHFLPNGDLSIHLVIPVGCRANVTLPCRCVTLLSCDRVLPYSRDEDGYVTTVLESGVYDFTVLRNGVAKR